jgi:hypothetical protein
MPCFGEKAVLSNAMCIPVRCHVAGCNSSKQLVSSRLGLIKIPDATPGVGVSAESFPDGAEILAGVFLAGNSLARFQLAESNPLLN